MTLQRTVSIAERKEPVRRCEKSSRRSPTTLPLHQSWRCKFIALILCGMSFRDAEPWPEPTLTSRKRGGKGYPARKWSAGKNAEYPQNVIYPYGVILEKSTRVTSAKDTSTKDYGIDLNYQCDVLAFLFNTFTKKLENIHLQLILS